MKPVILIFCSNESGTLKLRGNYADAVIAHGGIPLAVPLNVTREDLGQLAASADGCLFSGGVDLDPALYGEEVLNGTVEIDAARDRLEMDAAAEILAAGKPVLGICRGIQSVNVSLGGSLYQDIPAQRPSDVVHSQSQPGDVPTHTVSIVPGTLLSKITKQTAFAVNSFHHQAVKAPGRGLIVSARADDGLIEALEAPAHPFLLLVQWHPEYMYGTGAADAIFGAFVSRCKAIGER